MKALTLHPVYAAAIMSGDKKVEFRTWGTNYRGDILITSSSKKHVNTIPGHALCIAELFDCVPHTKDGETVYHWMLRNIRIIRPVPIKGKLSLWECDIEPEVIMPLENVFKLSKEDDEKLFTDLWADLIV